MRIIASLLVLMIATPAMSWDKEGFKRDIAWVTGAHAMDALSTTYMLEACPTCYEVNPFMRDNLWAKKALGAGVILGALYIARRHGGDQLATWVRWGIVMVLTVVSGWNYYLSRG